MMKPALVFPAELLLRAQAVRLLILDVDGVLTDGGLYFSEHGESIKRFSVLDGQGIKLLQRSGVTVGVITGRDSPALRLRLAALQIQHAFFGTEDKWPAANQLLEKLGFSWSQTAVMGDDWPDLPLLKHAQLAVTPANGHIENRAVAHFASSHSGGHGAVRELCDLILTAQGHYAQFLNEALSS
jgi:3-deoxy-D-manno-octulosonate 8-phosphate phosphatase (KDO 8-P phosphatase)